MTFLQDRVRGALAAFHRFLRSPNLRHDFVPARFAWRAHRFDTSDRPSVTRNKHRLALLKLIEHRLRLQVQFFCRNRAHNEKSNTFKVSPQEV